MFSAPIGRGRFFAYSAGLLIVEIVAVLACIAATTGFVGLATSSPGPAREGLALAALIVSLALVAIRGNFAWRRCRDAGGLKWVLGFYVVLSVLFAVLQAGTLLVYDFDGGGSNLGLNMLGLAITGLWLRILLAAPVAGGGWDAAAFADEVERDLRGNGGGPSGAVRPAAAPRLASERPAPAVRPAPATQRPSVARGGKGGFGRRGLA